MNTSRPVDNRVIRHSSFWHGLACALFAAGASAATQRSADITIGGHARSYIVATGNSLPAGRHPLVLVLHGHLGTAANALGAGLAPSPLSAWLAIADREKVLVAALQGLKGSDGRTGWRDCRSDDTRNPNVDDVAFASAVAQDLIAHAGADPERIYVMGMSNGAMMSQRLALEMRPAPAAIAAVAGTMALHSACTGPPHPVSVLIIHGTEDPLVPYGGGGVGLGARKTSSVLGVEATRDFWLRIDGLSEVKPVTNSLTHRGDDPTHVIRTLYGPDAGPQVEVLSVEHGGHVEPSLRYHYGPIYSHIVGRQNRDLESAEEAWSFFRTKSTH
jgi:polyhydroxybutyrate depolymerase